MEFESNAPKYEDICEAIDTVRRDQGHPPLKEYQVSTVIHLINQRNCLNQLPTGYGKTWPVVSLPSVLDTLRTKYSYDFIPINCRVLYIVPLINIYQSLAFEMENLKIPYQVMSVGSACQISKTAKVVFISPERLLNKDVMKSILDLNWSCISVDEPHLALEQGLSKSKKQKPFREAFSKLNHLNSLGTSFELHTATVTNASKLFQLVGRKSSIWIKQIVKPERDNLTYFLFAGKNAPDSILDLPIVIQSFEADTEGITLLYVQSVREGSELFITLASYCYDENLIKYSVRETSPEVPVAFLHSNLAEDKKRDILKRASSCEIKVLIATSAAGAGINLPVRRFIGWGLDREPSGIVQSQGRTARSPFTGEGTVVWVHKPKLHGQRIPSDSLVRDLLKSSCLRNTVNSWFSHDISQIDECPKPAEFCCSVCMATCIQNSNCQICKKKIEAIEPIRRLQCSSSKANELCDFLETLDINQALLSTAPKYDEKSLASEILGSLSVNLKSMEVKEALSIFNLGIDVTEKIVTFLNSCTQDTDLSSTDTDSLNSSVGSVSEDGSQSSELDTDHVDSEYFDSEPNE